MKGLCHLCLKSNQVLLVDKMRIYCKRCMALVKLVPEGSKDIPKYEKRLPFQDLPAPTANELQLAMERIEKYNIKCHEEYVKKHEM